MQPLEELPFVAGNAGLDFVNTAELRGHPEAGDVISTAADLRRRIGDRDEEPTDAAERSALIEAAEEQEALINQLEARREELLRRLGQPIRTNGS